MSFLLDPPLLVITGAVIERAIPEERQDLAEIAALGTFVGVSNALYNDVPGLAMFWKPFGNSSGRDFMVNSGVFNIDTTKFRGGHHAVSAAIFATYPLWLKVGRRIARRRVKAQADG